MMEELFERFISAARAGDAAATAQIFAEDAIVLRPGYFLEGRAAIERDIAEKLKTWRYLSGKIAVDFERQCGDITEIAGTESTNIAPHNGEPFTRHSHFVVTLRRGADRVWRISLDATVPDPA